MRERQSEMKFHKLHVIHFNEVLDSQVFKFLVVFCNHYGLAKFLRAILMVFFVDVGFQFHWKRQVNL